SLAVPAPTTGIVGRPGSPGGLRAGTQRASRAPGDRNRTPAASSATRRAIASPWRNSPTVTAAATTWAAAMDGPVWAARRSPDRPSPGAAGPGPTGGARVSPWAPWWSSCWTPDWGPGRATLREPGAPVGTAGQEYSQWKSTWLEATATARRHQDCARP